VKALFDKSAASQLPIPLRHVDLDDMVVLTIRLTCKYCSFIPEAKVKDSSLFSVCVVIIEVG
jgi:hypothetical protein